MANTVLESTSVGNSSVAAVMYNVTCSTGAATAEKTASSTSLFALFSGVRVRVTFTNENTAANPTLNINSTGAAPIMADSTNAAGSGTWSAGSVVDLLYNGTSWIIVSGGVTTPATEAAYNLANGKPNLTNDVTPLVDGVAAVGDSTEAARANHVHPTDTTRAPLASPAFTGNPTAPTQGASNNSTRIATTAFVQREFGNVVAALFSTSTSYAVGEYVIYSGVLYCCTTAHTGAWNASHFAAVTVGDELNGKLSVVGKGENLIDNWDFRSPINERGQTSYTGNGYTVDRWRMNYSSGVIFATTVDDGCLSFAKTGASVARFRQPIAGTFEAGTTLTLSMLAKASYDDASKRVTMRISNGTAILGDYAKLASTTSYQLYSVTNTLSQDVSDLWVEACWTDTAEFTMSAIAIKLELGDTQTLAQNIGTEANPQWVLLDPQPNYSEELFKCQTSVADSTDTYANKRNLVEGMAQPNANLLDNAYFIGGGSQQGNGQFPINQRGQTSYSSVGYVIDRWRLASANLVVDVNSDGVKLTAGGNAGSIGQTLRDTDWWLGKTVTLSMLYNGTKLVTRTNTIPATRPSASGTVLYQAFESIGSIQIYYEAVSDAFQVYLVALANKSYTINAVKLELGDTQTLAHQVNGAWMLNEAAPNFGEEMLKCQTAIADPSDQYANKSNLVEGMAQPNANFLDNAYFIGGGSQQGGNQFPINSRGGSSYTAATTSSAELMSIDRWFLFKMKLSLSSGYVTFQNTDSSLHGSGQTIENWRELLGKQVTASVLTAEGNLYSGSFSFPSSLPSSGETYLRPYVSTSFGYIEGVASSTVGLRLRFVVRANTSANICAAKLELGNTQTLAQKINGAWVLNEIPVFSEELFKCQTSVADSADTYANKRNIVEGMAQPNRNLLYNACFVGSFPVNQQGGLSYSGKGWFLSGWKNWAAQVSMDITSDGLRVYRTSGSTSTGTKNAVQVVTGLEYLAGKQVTMSALVQKSVVVDTSTTPPTETPTTATIIAFDGLTTTTALKSASETYAGTPFLLQAKFTFASDFGGTLMFCLRSPGGSGETTFVAAKLEEGDTQTLARKVNGQWVLNDIPDYQTELMKCRRYERVMKTSHKYGIFGLGQAYRSTTLILPVDCSTMSAVPTVSSSGSFRVSETGGGSDTSYAVTADISSDSYSSTSSLLLRATTTGLTQGKSYFLQANNDNTSMIVLQSYPV